MDPREEIERLEQGHTFTISVADRLKRLPPYLFGKINDLKYRKRQAGVDVIDLGMGNPTDPTPTFVVDKLREAVQDARNHRYSASWGVFNLRKEVAALYERRWNVSVDPASEVICTIGSKEGFSHLCLALLGPGDTCIVPAPAFPAHVYAPALASASVLQLDVVDPAAYLRGIAHTCETLHPRPKVVLVNFPHNPTGVTIEPDFYIELVALAKRFGFLVISDFAYSDVHFDGYTPPSFLTAPGAKEVGVEFTTMSKGYNMAGWRVGYCVGHSEMVRALGTIKGYYDYGIFQAVQIAAIVALRHGDETRREMCLEYARRRDVLVDGLRKGGWRMETPKAGMFAWAGIPEAWSHLGSIEIAMKLIEEAEVAVSPGRGFGWHGEGFLRLAIVENEQRLRQAVRQILRAMKQSDE